MTPADPRDARGPGLCPFLLRVDWLQVSLLAWYRPVGSCGLRGCRLRGHISRLFADVVRVLDGFESSCIQSPTVDASIQDLVRCSLTGSSGKRRRLDPHITGLAPIKRNVSQAGMCVSLAAAPQSPDQAWHFIHLNTFGHPFPVHARPQRPCFGLGLFRPLGEPACLLVSIDVLRARVCTGVCY